jgi:hypothetical protein
MTTSRLEMALDRLEDCMTEVTEARKAQAAIAAPAPAKANVKDKIVSGVKHVFNPANVAALKQPAAVPVVPAAKTVAAPAKSAPAVTPSTKIVPKPASVPQIMSRTPLPRRKMAGM